MLLTLAPRLPVRDEPNRREVSPPELAHDFVPPALEEVARLDGVVAALAVALGPFVLGGIFFFFVARRRRRRRARAPRGRRAGAAAAASASALGLGGGSRAASPGGVRGGASAVPAPGARGGAGAGAARRGGFAAACCCGALASEQKATGSGGRRRRCCLCSLGRGNLFRRGGRHLFLLLARFLRRCLESVLFLTQVERGDREIR